jgi:hypothetical protein
LAAVNKSGAFILYDRTNISAGPIQEITMASTGSEFRGVPSYDPVTNYVYVALPDSQGIYLPGIGAFSMTANCSYPIPSGARLRLHSTYACPSASSYPQANLLCNQAKQYGWILNDFTGINNGGGVRLGESSNGANPWNSSDYNQFLANVKVTDFDVMQLGTIK